MNERPKIFINRALFYRPLAVNVRASSLSINQVANGTVEIVPPNKTIRMYTLWEGGYDIDLSGLVIFSDNRVEKVGWNGRGTLGSMVTYSGDNTGTHNKNAEYLDINLSQMKKTDVEWVIVEARVFRGSNFGSFPKSGVLAGWMERDKPDANRNWLPETVSSAVKLANDSKTAYLSALHVPTNNIVFLDLSMGNGMVSGPEDAMKMRTYLENLVTLDNGSNTISWDKLNQGHILHLLHTVTDKIEEADIVFDENTTSEAVSALLNL